ncbi:restriction endonuclease, partial [Enterococcus faecalis]
NKRGDRRLTKYGKKKLFQQGLNKEGHMVYVSVNTQKPLPTITVMNITNNIPRNRILLLLFGDDRVNISYSRLIPLI